MKEGMEGVWKEVWRDPESVKRETEPRPIRGFLRNPDFRCGRDPLTGREGYSTIYEARRKVNTLIHSKPVKPIQVTRKSDFELVYRGENIKEDERNDYRRRTNDIRRKTSDIILKEQRFRDEQLNYLQADRQYKKDKSKIIDSVEQEYAKNAVKYNPWGKPGGGAPGLNTTRTKAMELKERTNYPYQQHPVRYPYEIFRARARQDDRPPVNPEKYDSAPGGDAAQNSSFDFFKKFGQPIGKPNFKRTLMLNDRFDTKMKDHHWIQTGPPEFGTGGPKIENQTYPGHSILPNKPSFKPETITGPSVAPRSTNQESANQHNPAPQSANEIVDILFPKNDSSLQSVKGSPSNPKKVELPRYSKEKIFPWDKYHGSI